MHAGSVTGHSGSPGPCGGGPGCSCTIDWRWWLSAHAGVHAFFVVLITGIPLLGLGEWLLHALIDLGKCRRRYNLAVDQGLHLLCKLLWAGLAVVALA